MKVKFLREFGGRETGEMHYPAGHEIDFDDELAQDLISRQVCISIEPEPEPDPEPKQKPKQPPINLKRGRK